MNAFESRWTTVNGIRIHARHRSGAPAPLAHSLERADAQALPVRSLDRDGAPTSPDDPTRIHEPLPVVMLHGLAVSHRYLMPTARALPSRHPVVVPDLAGFGSSAKPGRAYSVADHADLLSAWLDELGLRQVCVVGHSFGAEVAARLAAQRPDAVAALVLAGPTTDPRARTRRRLIARWWADLAVEQPWQGAVIGRDVMDARPWRVLATLGHSVHNQIEADLVRLKVRPLVLGGSLDAVAPLSWRAEVAAMTGGTQVTIPEAAHNVLTTSPRRSARAIATHLDQAPFPQ